MSRLLVLITAPLLLLTIGCVHAHAPEWAKVGDGMLGGVSGVAVASHQPERSELLVVRDNKVDREPRLARVTVADGRTLAQELAWPEGSPWPADLEAVSAVPGKPGHFVGLASAGQLYHVTVTGDSVALVGEPITMPAPDGIQEPNYEGFRIQEIGGTLAAVWADRGEEQSPATLFWGSFDLEKGPRVEGRAEIRVPFPTQGDVRDVSDLDVDAGGVVWGSAASDSGDDGPFASAVYALGALRKTERKALLFTPSPSLTRLRTFSRKVEGIALVPGAAGGIALGTDDEKQGGWFLFP